MNGLIHHLHHLFHFDGLLHWCFLIALFGFAFGAGWMLVRVLIPVRRLAKEAESIVAGELPIFNPAGGIREVEGLRQSLQHMVGQIALAQEREAAYRNALTESLENERKRIAREIHDDTIQSLILVAHNIERSAQAGMGNTTHLNAARAQLIQTVDNLRDMIADLRPTVLDELGLVAAVEALCDDHPTLTFAVEGDVYPLDAAQELAIFRAAQEVIHNALSHAAAGQISVTLHYTPHDVQLDVRDNGKGFSLPIQFQEFALRGRYGLIGLRERIQQIGGVVAVDSQPNGGGTQVSVVVPFDGRVAYGTLTHSIS